MVLPKEEELPHWKNNPVAVPFGLTVPFKVAELEIILVAKPVLAVG